jgi:hypothetical protein
VADAIERAAASTSWPDVLDNLAQGRVPGLVCSEREKSEIAAVAAKLTPIGQHVPAELDAYRRWAARVACYSFDWHRAEATRGDDGRGAPAPKR